MEYDERSISKLTFSEQKFKSFLKKYFMNTFLNNNLFSQNIETEITIELIS